MRNKKESSTCHLQVEDFYLIYFFVADSWLYQYWQSGALQRREELPGLFLLLIEQQATSTCDPAPLGILKPAILLKFLKMLNKGMACDNGGSGNGQMNALRFCTKIDILSLNTFLTF